MSPPAQADIDTPAFEALYERYQKPLYGFCLAKTGDPCLAEDIVQDVFERAFASRGRYDPARPFWPWIAAIAARECVDRHRRQTSSLARIRNLAGTLPREPVDTTSNTALRRLDNSRLQRDIRALPSRQRAALLLFAVDGWTYAEIAAQLGTSAEIVKALIVRARTKLRDAREKALAAACGLARHLHARLQQLARWSQSVASAGNEVLASWAQGLVPGSTAIGMAMAVLLGGVAPSSSAAAATNGREVVPVPSLPAAAAGDITPHPPPVAPPSKPAPPRTPEPPTAPYAGMAERAAHHAVASVLPPPPDAGPDTIDSTDVVVSPNYEEDPTVFATGRDPSGYRVSSPLLVSRDGGGSWRRARAIGLGHVFKLLLPPAYPHDNRLFAVSERALQVSRDHGESFETLVALPSLSDASISPAFNRGDPSMLLVAGGQLFEYRLDTGSAHSLVLGSVHPGRMVTSAAYAADHPNDPSILVASLLHGTSLQLWFSRCTRNGTIVLVLDCAELSLPDPRSQLLQVVAPTGPTPGPVWLLNTLGVYASNDDGATFTHTRPMPGSENPALGYYDLWVALDIAVLPSPTGASAILAQESVRTRHGDGPELDLRPNPPLLRTDDAGRSWTPIHVDLPGFTSAGAVAVTPTGRIIVGSGFGGLACSADDGRTWGHTCPTPDRASA